jgi:hypothetical protein
VSVAFDFHTLSLSIDQTMEEYRRASLAGSGLNILGLNIGEVIGGDRSTFLRFRHEHAHFTSFMASGLADLYGIFSDYMLVFLYSVLLGAGGDPANLVLAVPLLAGLETDQVPAPTRAGIERAWKQIDVLRAFFFGFGTSRPVGELSDSRPQDDFWSSYFDDRFSPILARYLRLMSSLTADGSAEENPTTGPALPTVTINGSRRELTSRAVMEAYAITIEVLATHLRKVETDRTFYGSPTVRNPGPLYSTAIENALAHGGYPRAITLEKFLAGKAPPPVYYTIAALAFAAMQVPVIQMLDGTVLFRGNLQTLCPAHRFWLMVRAMQDGKIPWLSADVRRKSDHAALVEWLRACHLAIGDRPTMGAYAEVQQRFTEDPTVGGTSPDAQSLIQMSWAARANFCREPAEYVLDAGLFAESYPCQPRYIRTSDAKLAISGDIERFQMRYLAEHAVPVMEAAVFAERWESLWAKMPEVPPTDRAHRIALSLHYCSLLFKYLEPGPSTALPRVALRPSLVDE